LGHAEEKIQSRSAKNRKSGSASQPTGVLTSLLVTSHWSAYEEGRLFQPRHRPTKKKTLFSYKRNQVKKIKKKNKKNNKTKKKL